MNKYFFYLLFLLVFVGISSCKEEVTLSTNYKEIPVIYGLLDQNESVHFIKINRAFVGPGSAFDLAQIPDSNYFEKVDAKVEELFNGIVTRSWNLRDTLISTKSTNGIFFAPQQKVYYFETGSNPLNEASTYRLTVDINEGKLQVTGETRLIQGFAQNSTAGHSLSSQNSQLRFIRNVTELTSTSISCTAGSAAWGNISLRFQIAEFRGNDSTVIEIPWNLGDGLPTSGSGKIASTAEGEIFYKLIHDRITKDNTITKRNFLGFKVIYTGGSQEFYNYNLVNQPSSSLTQSKPSFTNLKVTDGFDVVGIFSARQIVVYDKPFVSASGASNIRSIDVGTTFQLCVGAFTGADLFCSQHPNDVNTSFNCQ